MKTSFKNRKSQKIVAIVERPRKPEGLAIVMHGLGGFKEQKHIRVMAKSFLENGFTTVRFDAANNALGESDGKSKDTSATGYYQDLEDVITWSKSQKWYQEPFVLAGHSLGSMCITLYAEKYPSQVKALAPTSVVLSGKYWKETKTKKELADWQKTGWLIQESTSKPGKFKKIPWSFAKSMFKYDILKEANKLTMPVLLAAGDKDKGTPISQQKMFYKRLSGKKELHVIKNSGHTFRTKPVLKELKKTFDKWIRQELR